MNLVNYRAEGYQAIAMPYSSDGSVTSEAISDFVDCGTLQPVKPLTRMYLWYDDENVNIRVVCQEPTGDVRAENHAGGNGVWGGGDLLEIFFGSVEPEPWQYQFCVNAGGGTFSSIIDGGRFKPQVTIAQDSWTALLRFSLSLFRITDASMGFALARYSIARKEICQWGNMHSIFHQFESYGELFFGSYRDALFSKAGMIAQKELSRSEFEATVTPLLVAATAVTHGPMVSAPGETSAVISFGTAGRCGAYVDYRRSGSGEWGRVACDRQNALLAQNDKFHSCVVEKLEPGSEYEYRLVTIHSVTCQENFSEIKTFRTLDARKRKFTFAVISDLHSDAVILDRFLASPEVQSSDFVINLGDALSHGNGPDAIYRGFWDGYARGGKPVVFVRGNHEQLGLFCVEYTHMTRHPTGKTYFTFRHGDVLFIALDAGSDHETDALRLRDNVLLIQEQCQWLRELFVSPEFQAARQCVVLLHIPPYNLEHSGGRQVRQLLDLLKGSGKRIDALLCGHIHRYFEVAPNSTTANFTLNGYSDEKADAYPFPVFSNGTDTILHCRVDEAGISVTPVKF